MRAAASKRSSRVPAGSAGRGAGASSPAIAATQTSIVNTSRSAMSAALASSPSNHTATKPGRSGRSRSAAGSVAAAASSARGVVEMVGEQAVERVAAEGARRLREQQSRGRVEVDAVGRVERERPPGARELARRDAVGASEGARERRERAVPRAARRRGGRAARRAQLPRRPLEQQPAAQRDRRLARGGGDEPVEMVAREVREARERAPVHAWIVERLDDEVEQVAQAVAHACIVACRGLIAFDFSLATAPARRHAAAMATWSEFETAAPALAREVRERLDAHTHKTIATVRRDGSPRISGIETQIIDGDLWTGSMWQARKAHDLQRDPRFALHSGSDEPDAWQGDAKLAGVAEEITDPERVRAINGPKAPPGPSHLFRLDLREVSVVRLTEDRSALVIDLWTPDGGVRSRRRD